MNLVGWLVLFSAGFNPSKVKFYPNIFADYDSYSSVCRAEPKEKMYEVYKDTTTSALKLVEIEPCHIEEKIIGGKNPPNQSLLPEKVTEFDTPCPAEAPIHKDGKCFKIGLE